MEKAGTTAVQGTEYSDPHVKSLRTGGEQGPWQKDMVPILAVRQRHRPYPALSILKLHLRS